MTEQYVSIIVPCYNASQFINRCIESVIAQTFSGWELIIVNDGSSDNSLNICYGYAAVDSRIKVINKRNGGVSSARNLGIQEANGYWITFLDADDTLPQNSLKIFTDFAEFEGEKPDIIFCGFNVISKKPFPIIIPKCYKASVNSLALELFKPTDYPYQGYVWSKLYKKEIITKFDIRFDENIIFNEDRLFTFKYLSHCKIGVYSTYPVYNYYQTEGGAMSSINGPNFWKFETDLDAFVMMCKMSNEGRLNVLKDVVYYGTYVSYLKNKYLNKKFGNNKKTTNRRLRKKLLSVVPFFRVRAFEFADLKSRWKIRAYNIAVKLGLKHP